MRKSTVRRGFTLVEMLVVLAIIAVLSVLLLGVFSSVREGGRRTVCASNEKQIYLAFQLYLTDNDGQHPQQNDFPMLQGKGTWMDGIAPLVASAEIFHCPSDSEWFERVKNEANPIYGNGKQKQWASSYIVNTRALTDVSFFGKVSSFSGLAEHPANTVLLSDGATQAFGEAPYAVSFSELPFNNLSQAQSDAGNGLGDPKGALKEINGCCAGTCNCVNLFAPTARHNGRANVLFFDGHVKSMPNSQWYFPDTPYLDPLRGG